MNEIELLIRARYPIIYIIGDEEDRISEEISDIAKNLNKNFYVWSITTGFLKYSHIKNEKINERCNLEDVVKSLIEIFKRDEEAIYLFKDLHNFIDEPIIKRLIKDLSYELKNTYKTLILLSPVQKISPDIEKDVIIFDYPYPNREQLKNFYLKIVRGNSGFRFRFQDDEKFLENLSNMALGLTLTEFENVISKILVKYQKITEETLKEIFEEKKQIVRKSGILEFYESNVSFDDVGGLYNLKKWMAQRKNAFSEQARKFGLPLPKGILLLGIQGCGKSLCAKASANFLNLPLLRLDMGKIFSSFVGSSEANVRKAINIAESISPIILWIDELDKAFAGMKASGFSDGGTTARVIATLLTWLQEKTTPVFVIATANDISALPAEVFRKGRFDEIFFVDLPNVEERKEIFRIHIKKYGRKSENYNVSKLARITENFSGAEIEQVIIQAMYEAFYERKELSERHIEKAVKETIPLAKIVGNQIEKIRKWARIRTKFAS